MIQLSNSEVSPQQSPLRKRLAKRWHVSPGRQLPQYWEVSQRHAFTEYEEPLYIEIVWHGGRCRYHGGDIDPLYGTDNYVRPKRVGYVYASPSGSSPLPSLPRRWHRPYFQLDPMTSKPATKHHFPQQAQQASHPVKHSRASSIPLPLVSHPKASHVQSSHQTASSRATYLPEMETSTLIP